MSALMVDKLHIDLLVQTTVDGPPGVANPGKAWRPFHYYTVPNRVLRELRYDQLPEVTRTIDLDGAEALGQMLAAQNAASVRARYDDADGRGMIPVWADEGYRYVPPRVANLTVVELLKAIACYEYQACETDEWPDSEAFQFCEALRQRLITHLPGYDEAPWGWGPEEIKKRR